MTTPSRAPARGRCCHRSVCLDLSDRADRWVSSLGEADRAAAWAGYLPGGVVALAAGRRGGDTREHPITARERSKITASGACPSGEDGSSPLNTAHIRQPVADLATADHGPRTGRSPDHGWKA
jgi:hypothetical protein